MSLRKWFGKWFSSTRTPIQNKRKPAARARKSPLGLEVLEDRITPASTALIDGTFNAIITGDGGVNGIGMSILGGTTLQITDTSGITAGSGFAQIDGNTVTAPLASITGKNISIDA